MLLLMSIKKQKINEQVNMKGEVTKVNTRDIIIDTGDREIAVRTDMVGEFGVDKLTKGDNINVKGKVKTSIYNGKQLVADEINKL
mgnify:CR=1 FL=1